MDTKIEGKTIWIVGLPCSGKTTLGDALAEIHPAIRLDGDNVRTNLCDNLGFTPEERAENVRRCASVAQLLNEQGYDVIASFVCPLNSHQEIVKYIIKNLSIVYVNTPATICEERDVKGMWKKARNGLIRGFTGYDSCFEIPTDIDMIIDTKKSVQECVKQLNTLF